MPHTEFVTLSSSQSCYIRINRTDDGSYGTMTFTTEGLDQLLLFDDDVLQYQSETRLGLIEVSNNQGWEERKVFLANIGTEDIDFEVVFESSSILTTGVTLMLFSLLH